MSLEINEPVRTCRRGNARADKLLARHNVTSHAVVSSGMPGGKFAPLSDAEMTRVADTAKEFLATIGMADTMPEVLDLALKAGCTLGDDDRLLLP